MADRNEKGIGVLADARWERLAPLIKAVRSRGKSDLRDLRRVIEAILW